MYGKSQFSKTALLVQVESLREGDYVTEYPRQGLCERVMVKSFLEEVTPLPGTLVQLHFINGETLTVPANHDVIARRKL